MGRSRRSARHSDRRAAGLGKASGKTTTARRHARSVVHLDQAIEAEQFRADPDVALAGLPEPVLLDEWQAVPEVLGAVKHTIDSSPRRGRFIVTGSVRDDLLRSSGADMHDLGLNRPTVR